MNGCECAECHDVMVCVRRTSKRWCLKIVQVTMKHDPIDAMYESTQNKHPSCIYILCWSLKHSVKRTWTNSTFSTNGSAWSVMVTGIQSRVCEVALMEVDGSGSYMSVEWHAFCILQLLRIKDWKQWNLCCISKSMMEHQKIFEWNMQLCLMYLWLLEVYVCWFLNWIHMSFWLCSTMSVK